MKENNRLGPCPFTEEEWDDFFENLPEICLRLKEWADKNPGLLRRNTNVEISSNSSQDINETSTV